jgi:hypothetical protein
MCLISLLCNNICYTTGILYVYNCVVCVVCTMTERNVPNWTLNLTADFSVYLTRCTDFDSGLFRLLNLDTLILITEFCD